MREHIVGTLPRSRWFGPRAWMCTNCRTVLMSAAASVMVLSGCADHASRHEWVTIYQRTAAEPWMENISFDRGAARRHGDTLFVRIRYDFPHPVPPVTDSTQRINRFEESRVVDCRDKQTLRRLPMGYYLGGKLVVLGPLPGTVVMADSPRPIAGAHDVIAELVCTP